MKICQVCGASFVSKGNLKQHMEAIHEKKRDFACNVCDAKFYFKHKMEEHVKGMNLDFLSFLDLPIFNEDRVLLTLYFYVI